MNTSNQISRLQHYDDHKLILHIKNKQNGLEGYIAIHRKSKFSPSFGATRLWSYDNRYSALDDVLRLSKLMSYKSALAGLGCGGAKAVLVMPKIFNRNRLLKSFANEVNSLEGSFVTGTDLGLFPTDLATLRKHTRYVVGFNQDVAKLTAIGVYESIKRCLVRVGLSTEVSLRTFAIQGVGKVGLALLELLINDGCRKIYISDYDSTLLRAVHERYQDCTIMVKPDYIHKQDVDVFSPCGLGNALTGITSKELICKVVSGGANNQLEADFVGDFLFKKGILYAPDYVVNSGGLISVFYEYKNSKHASVEVRKKINMIPKVLDKIFDISIRNKLSTHRVADQLAKKIVDNYE